MSDKSISELIAESSLGAAAWCTHCGHPRDVHHKRRGCMMPLGANGNWEGDHDPDLCVCQGFEAMSPHEWLNKANRS